MKHKHSNMLDTEQGTARKKEIRRDMTQDIEENMEQKKEINKVRKWSDA